MNACILTLFLGLPALIASTDPIEDPIGQGDSFEIVHLFRGQYVGGIAVSASGRKFCSFPNTFDEANTNLGDNGVIQVAELVGLDEETAFPNKEINSPPDGAVNTNGILPVTKGLEDYFLNVPTVVIDSNDTLWILDAGRVRYGNILLGASYGGTKLMSIDLNTDSITRTYIFPDYVATPVSLLNDMTFDLLRGYTYIADLSPEGYNGLVVLNLDDGSSFRVLQNDFSVMPEPAGVLPVINGKPVYEVRTSCSGQIYGFGSIRNGVGGVTLSPDMETLYYSGGGLVFFYSVPTELLRNNNTAATDISSAVRTLGQLGVSGVLTADSHGDIYQGNAEQNSIVMYNATSGFAKEFIRDKFINFISRLIIGPDSYLYFTVTQFHLLPTTYNGEGQLGEDRRKKPYFAGRVKLPEGATLRGT